MREDLSHQGPVVEWARGRKTPAFFLEMRLGKCHVLARWASTIPGYDRLKCLVVCPSAVVPTWMTELAADGEHPVDVSGGSAGVRRFNQGGMDLGRWFVMNDRSVVDVNAEGKTSDLAKLPWDLVAIDESTSIKNPASLLSKAAVGWLARAEHRAILTGLPNPEKPLDYVQQLFFLLDDVMGCRNFWEWRALHCVPSGFGWSLKHESAKRLRAVIREHGFFMTRREAGLPDERMVERRYVELPAKTWKTVRRVRKHLELNDELCTGSALVASLWEHRLVGGRFPIAETHHDAKLDELERLVVDEEFAQKRVVVVARYNAEVEAIAARMRKAGASVGVVTGGTPRAERTDLVRSFNHGSDRGPRVLAAQAACVQKGVDLSAAAAMIVFSNYWDHELRAQLEARTFHPRRGEPSMIVDLTVRDTVDEDVLDALSMKKIDAKAFNFAIKKKFESRRSKP